MRVSKYIIFSNVTDSETMLIHGYSGALDIVSSDLAAALKKGITDKHIIDSIEPDTFSALIEREYLTEKSPTEEEHYVDKLATALHRKDKLIDSGYTIIITYDCNFKCPYCFEQNNAISKKTISKSAVNKAFCTIKHLQNSRIIPSNSLTLFGGEPLLKENLPIIEYIVSESKKLNLTIDAVTNGFDLDYYKDLLGPDGIMSLQITIDGMDEIHNQKRRHKQNKPTFGKIIDNIALTLQKSTNTKIRFNADKTNFHDYFKLKELFDKLGYTKEKTFHLYPSILINHEDETHNVDTFFSDKEFIDLYSQNNTDFKINDYSAFIKLYHSIKSQKPLPYHATFCGSQTGSVVFDPFYNLYPCWEKVGNREHCIGTYRHGKPEWIEETYNAWNGHNVMSYDDCQKCPCALLCGGGCKAHNINGHRCTHMKELIDIAAKRAYRELLCENKPQ